MGSLLGEFRSRARSAVALVLLGWLLLSQTLLLVHRVDHAVAEHGFCALCVAGDHSAAPISESLPPVAAAEPETVEARVVSVAGVVTLPSYHSRAPPPSQLHA